MKQYETNKSNHFETNGDILARCLLRLKGLEMENFDFVSWRMRQ